MRTSGASPLETEPALIDWSDRSWWAWGANAGLELSWVIGPKWSAFGAMRLRALYYGDAESWELTETRDIIEQTGNIVFFNYYHPVAFHPSFDVGMTWRR